VCGLPIGMLRGGGGGGCVGFCKKIYLTAKIGGVNRVVGASGWGAGAREGGMRTSFLSHKNNPNKKNLWSPL